MTRNLYIGTGLGPVFRTRGAAGIPAAIGALWREVQASDVPERMAAVADEIAADMPDLVGLQEAASYEVQAAFRDAAPSTKLDFVALLVAALAERGARYRCVAAQANLDVELPDDVGSLVHFTDRDVILARYGTATRSSRAAHFATSVEQEAAGVLLRLPRGWVGVEVDAGDDACWFVNTHLEMAGFPRIQEAQARELLAALAGEARRTILVGDLNSSADGFGGVSYRLLRDAGFEDAWAALRGTEPGETCCFSSDLRSGTLGVRVDVVLHRGGFEPTAVHLVGSGVSSRAASGRWPSDHAGVVAELALASPDGGR